MPIKRIIQEYKIRPVEAQVMQTAYDLAIRALQLRDDTDPIAQALAEVIANIVRTGERNATIVYKRAIRELGMKPRRNPRGSGKKA